jgi:poly(3-hydroxybutyrate) depolymerase
MKAKFIAAVAIAGTLALFGCDDSTTPQNSIASPMEQDSSIENPGNFTTPEDPAIPGETEDNVDNGNTNNWDSVNSSESNTTSEFNSETEESFNSETEGTSSAMESSSSEETIFQPSSSETPANTFGWAKGNAPVPTRGCGKTWNRVKSGSYEFQWSQGTRTIRIDIPDNYDNNHPYRLVFGMHCMGGWAGGVRDEGYYGLKPLDVNKTTIFVAPEGNGNWAPWGAGDYILFDELLADLQSNLCIDSSRVFSTGFSYGSMYSNMLSRSRQDVLRGVVLYETADVNIDATEDSGKPIAWMGVHGMSDTQCYPDMGRSARNLALKNASAPGKDATKEVAQESNGEQHICYNYKDVDERFPVRWCTDNKGHWWDHKDPGQNVSWVPKESWDFITQF